MSGSLIGAVVFLVLLAGCEPAAVARWKGCVAVIPPYAATKLDLDKVCADAR